MKSIISFYLLIFIPLAVLVLCVERQYIASTVFLGGLFLYAFAYHPFICALRLLANKKIPKSLFWHNFIPFWNLKYFGYLFFNVDTHQPVSSL